MKRVILTIALVLCAASAFAKDHRDNMDRHDNGHHNGHHNGKHWKHDSHKRHECRNEQVVHRSTVIYRPEYRRADPRISISVFTPELLVSFLSGR